jgi:tRNA(adenine34) deaminase
LEENTHDLIFMKEALKLAKEAEKQGEVPVGAILVHKNQIIASSFNQKESSKKATAHAEILAIEKASLRLNRWRLNDCILYVTLEPCPMCAGALVAARLKRLVYACKDPKAGAIHSLYRITQDPRLNHHVDIHSGVLQEESRALLKEFFRKKRKNNK